ncbi:MAG: benzoate-CoA ligase family protein [Acidobacteriota bacterium]
MMRGDEAHFNLFDYFLGDKRLSRIGDATAIHWRGEPISYNRLREETDHWTERLSREGISEGDGVAILLADSPEFIAAFLATVRAGAIAVLINTFLAAEETRFILNDSGARLLITEPPMNSKSAADLQTIIVDREKKDSTAGRGSESAITTGRTPAFLLYTSGSTGVSKGVLHLHRSIPVTVENYSRHILRLTPEDRVYSSSRLFFAYGLGNSLSFPLAEGSSVILDSERPTPQRIARMFEEESPSVFFAVPAVYNALLEFHRAGNSLNVSSLRLCISAGEALPSRVFEDWKQEFGFGILDGIGSTEMLHIFISNREGEAVAGSSGKVVEGYEAKLTGDAGEPVTEGEPGGLWIRGESATAGYWNLADVTERTIQGGWVKTGDVYRCDEQGYFFHIGRSDDCFKVSGLWVSPVEVESVLVEHEAVSEAAVVPSVDEAGLATARAWVVIRKGEEDEAMKESLLAYMRERLPRYKAPSQIEFIRELPRTSTGKVQRFRLRTGG